MNCTTFHIDIDGLIGGPEGFQLADMKAALQAADENRAEQLIIHINSLGGDLNTGIAIHDLLAAYPAHKEARISGMTASAATLIAMGADEISMSANALFLIHNASTRANGDRNELQHTIRDLEKLDQMIANVYSRRTQTEAAIHLELMNRNAGRGEWLSAEEALQLGYIDSIHESIAIAACADESVLESLALPPIPFQQIKSTHSMNKSDQSLLNQIRRLFTNQSPEELSKLEESLKAKEEQIAKLQAQLAEKEARIAELETQLGQDEKSEPEVQNLKKELLTLKDEIAAFRNEVALQQGQSLDPVYGGQPQRDFSNLSIKDIIRESTKEIHGLA